MKSPAKFPYKSFLKYPSKSHLECRSLKVYLKVFLEYKVSFKVSLKPLKSLIDLYGTRFHNDDFGPDSLIPVFSTSKVIAELIPNAGNSR